MREPRELQEARRCLARAEAEYGSADGVALLADGLALLEDVADAGTPADARVAKNLAAAYAGRIYASVKTRIDTDRAVTEPDLEHLFRVMLTLDQAGLELPPSTRALKVEIVRRLIDRYYEGHPAAQKLEALRELERLAAE
jgi:hypothetical protein